MTYREYGTFKKAEQLLQMAMRDDYIAGKLRGKKEDILQVMALVGIDESEFIQIQEDFDEITGRKDVGARWG